MADQDRSTIGLTPEAVRQLEDIQLKGWFDDAQDVARFAAAYAIRANVAPGAASGVDTRWAIGLFDRTGEFRALMATLHPDIPTPVRALEHLTNDGLKLVHERLVGRGESPSALLD